MNTFIWGLIFSLIGIVYISIGRKLHKFAFFAFGILLILYPYMVDSLSLTIAIGAVFTIAPFLASRFSE